MLLYFVFILVMSPSVGSFAGDDPSYWPGKSIQVYPKLVRRGESVSKDVVTVVRLSTGLVRGHPWQYDGKTYQAFRNVPVTTYFQQSDGTVIPKDKWEGFPNPRAAVNGPTATIFVGSLCGQGSSCPVKLQLATESEENVGDLDLAAKYLAPNSIVGVVRLTTSNPDAALREMQQGLAWARQESSGQGQDWETAFWVTLMAGCALLLGLVTVVGLRMCRARREAYRAYVEDEALIPGGTKSGLLSPSRAYGAVQT